MSDDPVTTQPPERTPEEDTLPRVTGAKPESDAALTIDSRPSAGPPPMVAHSPAGYEIVGELGHGGMGVVYRAVQAKLRRVVALKMILAGGHAGSIERDRFRSEAEATARLQHPHIVQIHEVGEHDGLPFFSLELCDSGSLAMKLAGMPLPPREAAGLIEKLARAMQLAHEMGVIHRDLKPANILFCDETPRSNGPPSPLSSLTPKITDFGLAKKLDEVGHTATGAIMGTPSYMAPEQAAGKKEIGPACDVYALGAILYECLTGRPPFRAATPMDTILQVMAEEPVSPRRVNSAVPRDLESVCLKCLEKDPARRYTSAAALAQDLAAFLSGEPVIAAQAGLIEQLTSALERVQLHDRFAEYGSLLLWLAPLMFVPEIWVTIVVLNDWPGSLLPLAQFGRVCGFLIVVGRYRGWRWAPQGQAERQLWSVWGGYLIACFVIGLSGRLAQDLFATRIELTFYQPWAALTALAFFALTSFWGYCAIVGIGFLGLAFVMAIDLRWAPLEFGAVWFVVLILLGLRLRRLGRMASR